jgi:hypothetical protein
MNAPRILAYDVERIPLLAHVWGLWDQRIGINQIVLPGQTVSFAARWVGDPKSKAIFRSTFHDGETVMLDELWSLMDEADALMGWNSYGFDRKHVNTAFIRAGMTPPSPSQDLDLMKSVRHQFKFESNKLDYVAQDLGVGSKLSHEGFGLWLKVMAGDEKAWARFRRYNLQDVNLLIELYDKLLPWLSSHPNRVLFDGEGCPRCGPRGKLERRGTRKTSTGTYPRFHCTRCGSWSQSGKRLDGADIREVK